MSFRSASLILLVFLSAQLVSCSSGKSTGISQVKADTVKHVASAPQVFTYRFYFGSVGSVTKPHDEIWIDTSGQMTFDTHQHMNDGSWKSPHGIAYLEPRDEDTMLTFIKQDVLFSIDESDVTPQCPDGDQYTIRLYRSDLHKKISFRTNTCALEYNLLTGQQRKIFPAFIAFIDRMRARYRPLYTE